MSLLVTWSDAMGIGTSLWIGGFIKAPSTFRSVITRTKFSSEWWTYVTLAYEQLLGSILSLRMSTSPMSGVFCWFFHLQCCCKWCRYPDVHCLQKYFLIFWICMDCIEVCTENNWEIEANRQTEKCLTIGPNRALTKCWY